MDLIKVAEEAFATGKQHPEFKAGDTVTVAYKIIEGSKERIQLYRGVVIRISGHGDKKRFTVRKMSGTIGVERIFPLESPNIDSIEVNKHGKVRRAKLYYLRKLTGKKARIKEKRVAAEKVDSLKRNKRGEKRYEESLSIILRKKVKEVQSLMIEPLFYVSFLLFHNSFDRCLLREEHLENLPNSDNRQREQSYQVSLWKVFRYLEDVPKLVSVPSRSGGYDPLRRPQPVFQSRKSVRLSFLLSFLLFQEAVLNLLS